jgi:hypothetical protein
LRKQIKSSTASTIRWRICSDRSFCQFRSDRKLEIKRKRRFEIKRRINRKIKRKRRIMKIILTLKR